MTGRAAETPPPAIASEAWVLVVDASGRVLSANPAAVLAGGDTDSVSEWTARAGIAGDILVEGSRLVHRASGGGAWLTTVAVSGQLGDAWVVTVSPVPGSDRRDELADALTDVAGVIEEDGSIRWVNRAVTARLGWDPSEVAGREAIDFIHPSDRTRARRVFALAAGGRRRSDTQLRLVHADGSFRPVSLSLLPRRMGEPDAELVFLAREAVGLQAELEYLAHLAQHDPLTGLANRILLQDRLLQGLARARRSGRPLVVAVVDLDGFKSVNDAYGHPIGDVVLVEVARRLVRSVRPADTVARLGGDEFVVVAEGLTLPDEAVSFGARLIGGLQEPIAVPGRDPVSVGASAGIAAGMDQTPNQLVAEADFALLEAKRAGRGRTILSWERP